MGLIRWGDLRRHHDLIHRVRATTSRRNGEWMLEELAEVGGKQRWRDRQEPKPSGGVWVPHFGANEEHARVAAERINERLDREAAERKRADNQAAATLESDRLKREKSATRRDRLEDEERRMLEAAIARNVDMPQPQPQDVITDGRATEYREEILGQIASMPWLRIMACGKRVERVVLESKDGLTWTVSAGHTDTRCYQLVERARIAGGFGLKATDNWAATKAKIRRMLLPRANELLQLASVRRMLGDAIARGVRVVVSGRTVFWYETSGSVGWIVKETASSSGAEPGATLWLEGQIVSKNHGRIVVLPYVKESGEKVTGHTRNAPHDGDARPRDPREYLEIPFERYEGDLVIGLHGELHYD